MGNRESRRAGRWITAVAVALVVLGGVTVTVAVALQRHAPQPSAAAAGTTGAPTTGGPHGTAPAATAPVATAPAATTTTPGPAVVGPVLARSEPESISIPAIGVHSLIQYVGLNPDGTLQAPPLDASPLTNEAAWYKYSPTPGQPGPALIEGHIDSALLGPSVFFRLGALRPTDRIDVTLADGTVAVFEVTGVREYAKSSFPSAALYASTDYAALRLVTCGGRFDYQTRSYLSNTVVYARLVSSHPSVAASGT